MTADTCTTCGDPEVNHYDLGARLCAKCATCSGYVAPPAPTTESTDADRVRLAEIQRHHRHDVDLGRWDNDELDLYRMAEDGIAARDALAAERSLREAAEGEVARWEERFPCDGLCSEYPEEDCSRHGRHTLEVWQIAAKEQARADAARADLATAQATLAAVRALHRPITTHDECPHEDTDECDGWETTDGLIVCGPSLGSVCDECRNEDGDRYVEWPCATIRALDTP